MIRQRPGQIATVIIALLLFVFIAYPLGSVLVESFVISGPMTVFEHREMTQKALDLMEPKAAFKIQIEGANKAVAGHEAGRA